LQKRLCGSGDASTISVVVVVSCCCTSPSTQLVVVVVVVESSEAGGCAESVVNAVSVDGHFLRVDVREGGGEWSEGSDAESFLWRRRVEALDGWCCWSSTELNPRT
jgi:hypothetical protein